MFFGGGGSENYAFGEGGVHAWLIGNGDTGSLGLSVAAGGAGLMADNEGDNWDSSVDYVYLETIGPMMSLGLDYRLGFNRR
jgi:hypothetical protein